VTRIRRIIARDNSPEGPPAKGKPPQLCQGCPHRMAFAAMKKYDCIIEGDIGCYTLSVMAPFETMDSCLCMGASITNGLGMRHVLPDDQARRVVSVLGDSTFMHSGLTGLAEMVYNPPKTGHIVIILDNATTAMTGMQEHPGTGRKLDHQATGKVVFEEVAKAMGVTNVVVVDGPPSFDKALKEALSKDELTLIIMRRVCRLAETKIKAYEQAAGRS
jgi:indolepyruvate ferredoxin oxidoreductase, alpha subunit